MEKEKVFSLIKCIPSGKITTYKSICKKLNSRAYRAVGKIISTNTDYSHIPCHRVVCSNRKIGGYNRGTRKKEELLKKEGITIKNGKIVEWEKQFYNL